MGEDNRITEKEECTSGMPEAAALIAEAEKMLKEHDNESSGKKASGTYSQTEDAVLKVTMQFFGEELLPYLGIEGTVKHVAPTELVHLELKKLFQDFNLVMEDGSWKHFEFQSTDEKLEGLKRFRVSESLASYPHTVALTTYVLFSGKIEHPITEYTEGINTYRIIPIIMTGHDADKVINELEEKKKRGEPITKADLVPLTLCPLMGGEMSQKERIKRSLKLISEPGTDTVPREDIRKIEAVIYAMAEKFLDATDVEEVREAIKMTRLGKMLVDEGRAEGRAEGLVTLVIKKLRKNYSVPAIADMLEEDEAAIRRICDIANKYAPDYDVEAICSELSKIE